MKKIKYFAMLFFAAMVSAATVSCGDDGDSTSGGDNSGNGGGGSQQVDSVTTAAAQKAKLESVARELVGKVNAEEFDNIKEIVDGVRPSDGQEIEDWFEGCKDACLVGESGDSLYYNLYALSNFTGSFELQGNKWENLNAKVDYLQFKFKDKAGNECVLKLTHSGKETTVHHESFDEKDYEYRWYGYYSAYLKRRNVNSYVIPENINVTLTQGGKTVVSTDVHTSLSVGSGDVDITRDGAEVSVTTTVNDYKVVLQKALYSKGTSVSVPSLVMTKGNEELISLTAQATGDISDLDNPVSKTARFEVKVLGGKARVIGNLTDGQTLQRNLENADKNENNETEYKRYINNANTLIDVKLYLDNSSKYGAYLRLQPFEKNKGWGYKAWEYKPILVFGDGSSYTFEEYFDEVTFDNVINKVQNIIDDFVRMFGE